MAVSDSLLPTATHERGSLILSQGESQSLQPHISQCGVDKEGKGETTSGTVGKSQFQLFSTYFCPFLPQLPHLWNRKDCDTCPRGTAAHSRHELSTGPLGTAGATPCPWVSRYQAVHPWDCMQKWSCLQQCRATCSWQRTRQSISISKLFSPIRNAVAVNSQVWKFLFIGYTQEHWFQYFNKSPCPFLDQMSPLSSKLKSCTRN